MDHRVHPLLKSVYAEVKTGQYIVLDVLEWDSMDNDYKSHSRQQFIWQIYFLI